MTDTYDGHKRILYGRRRGKTLRKNQQHAIEEIFPRLRVPLNSTPIDLNQLFNDEANEYWLEIGFGNGEHLAWQAEHHPKAGLIGCEPFLNGVAVLIGKLEKADVKNVRLHNEAAEILMDQLSEGCLNKCFLLFADPWPKSSHHKRRFVTEKNIASLARILDDNAELRIATDHVDYGAWILWHMLRSHEFTWEAESPSDWRFRKEDWPQTRYEAKALREGRKSVYYTFRRRPRTS